jgi:hypothetical protein
VKGSQRCFFVDIKDINIGSNGDAMVIVI